MDLENLSDVQLNRYIADRKASSQLAKAQMEEALEEWRSRHGGLAGTRVELGGVIVQLEASSRWDAEHARAVLADRPDLLSQIQVPVLDRARAKEVLDEETYQRCQKMGEKPRTRVVLESDTLSS